jgi:hypothetical protein
MIVLFIVEVFCQDSDAQSKPETEHEIMMPVKRKVYERHQGNGLSQGRRISQSAVIKAGTDDRVPEIAFPFMFSVGLLLDIQFKCREMCIVELEFEVMCVEKSVIYFAFNEQVPVEQLMFKLAVDVQRNKA